MFKKNILNLFPYRDNVIIIDDSIYAWPYCKNNLIKIREYKFFIEKNDKIELFDRFNNRREIEKLQTFNVFYYNDMKYDIFLNLVLHITDKIHYLYYNKSPTIKGITCPVCKEILWKMKINY